MKNRSPKKSHSLFDKPGFIIGDEKEENLLCEVDGPPWIRFDGDLYDILIYLEVFSSRSQAKKNWTNAQLQNGYNRFTQVGKRRLDILIYKSNKDETENYYQNGILLWTYKK